MSGEKIITIIATMSILILILLLNAASVSVKQLEDRNVINVDQIMTLEMDNANQFDYIMELETDNSILNDCCNYWDSIKGNIKWEK